MKGKVYQIYRSLQFKDWFYKQTEKAQVQIDDRLSRIQDEGYFGDYKSVSDDEIWELKWKNGQQKDICKSKSIYKKHIS